MAPKRGPYKARERKIIPDDLLDAIERQDTSIIPPLTVLPSEDSGQTGQVRIGVRKDDGKKYDVSMMPIHRKSDSDDLQHGLKYYYYDDDKMREAQFDKIEWEDDNIAFKTFSNSSAASRWPNRPEQKKQHLKWLLFVWQHITGQELPTGKTTSKKRKQADVKKELDDDDSSIHTPGSRKRTKRSSANLKLSIQSTSSKVNPHQAIFDIFDSWLHGTDLDIHNDNVVRRICGAYPKIHGKEPRPSFKILRDAYLERLETGVPNSRMTQVWTEFRRHGQMYSTAPVTLDLTDYGAIAQRSLKKLNIDDTSAGKLRIPGPPAEPLPNPLPSIEESWRIVEDWADRGWDEWDEHIHTVRAARYVLECDFLEKEKARGWVPTW